MEDCTPEQDTRKSHDITTDPLGVFSVRSSLYVWTTNPSPKPIASSAMYISLIDFIYFIF